MSGLGCACSVRVRRTEQLASGPPLRPIAESDHPRKPQKTLRNGKLPLRLAACCNDRRDGHQIRLEALMRCMCMQNSCACVCVCTYMYIYIYADTYTYIYIYVYMFVCLLIGIFILMYLFMLCLCIVPCVLYLCFYLCMSLTNC